MTRKHYGITALCIMLAMLAVAMPTIKARQWSQE